MIAIVDYGAGNLTSVKRALDYLGASCRIVSTGEELRSACGDSERRIIFPGVGHAKAAMKRLRERQLDVALREAFQQRTPILGICLGAQIVLSHSEEGDTPCLDLIPGVSPRFRPVERSLKTPHMGWNEVVVAQQHPILKGVRGGEEFYFVHSYYPLPHSDSHVFATCEYGLTFPAAIGSRNLFATQFHPEKSGRIGLGLLRNFCEWDGATEERPHAE
ncbi:MAG: imidazole glycerol phosphate synthase subunit HisH [Anaerolineae bacterium]